MAIVSVAEVAANASGVDSITVDNDGVEGNFNLGLYAYNDNNAHPVSGGTFDSEIDDGIEDGNGEDTTVAAFYEFVSATPPANYVLDGSDGSPAGTSRVAGIVASFSGVDTTTPFDVTWNQGSHYAKRVNDTTPAIPSITTVTPNAKVLVYAYTNNNTITSMGELAGFNKIVETLGNDRNIALFEMEVATPDTIDPGELTPTGITAADETVFMVFALRPAAVASFAIASVGVDEQNIVFDTEIRVRIRSTGGGFGATQGAGFVQLADYDPAGAGSGTAVNQTIESWSDTDIYITAGFGALTEGTARYLYVQDNGGSGASIQVELIDPATGDPALRYTPADVNLVSGTPISVDLSGTVFHPNVQDTLSFGAIGLPDNLAINAVTGNISGIIAPDANLSSPYTVDVTVTDLSGDDVTDQFTWTVNVPGAPSDATSNRRGRSFCERLTSFFRR